MVYARPTSAQFFDQLLNTAQRVTCVLFEPISYQQADAYGIKPTFTRKQAQAYGMSETLWPTLKDFERQGRIKLIEVFPDFVGPSPLSTMSLVHFEKAGE